MSYEYDCDIDINENKYDAIYLIGTIIPQSGVTCINIIRSSTVVKSENIQQHFNRFINIEASFSAFTQFICG